MSTLDELLQRAQTYSAFADHQRHLCSSADLDEVIEAAQRILTDGQASAVTVFNDFTGQRTEVDADVRSRLAPPTEEKTGPGRPRLGVVSREVSLLPRHWEWLNAQSGGASAALRRLVEEARKRFPAQEAARGARDAAGRAMSVLAGDQPCFEESLRALYADNFELAIQLMTEWPHDLEAHFRRVLGNAAQLREAARQEG